MAAQKAGASRVLAITGMFLILSSAGISGGLVYYFMNREKTECPTNSVPHTADMRMNTTTSMMLPKTTMMPITTMMPKTTTLPKTVERQAFSLDLGMNKTFIFKDAGGPVISGVLGKSLMADGADEFMTYSDSIYVKWNNWADLSIKRYSIANVSCLDVSWKGQRGKDQVLQDCFDMDGAHWYGGAEMWRQLWPLEKLQYDFQPYVTDDQYKKHFGGVLERYFFSSSGVAFYVDDMSPLHISIRDKQLCFKAEFDGFPYLNPDKVLPHLNYTICKAGDVRKIHSYMSKKHFAMPEGHPNETLFNNPICTTWAEFKKAINSSEILNFVNDFKKQNITCSQLEIDDRWTSHYGDFTFAKDKFSDAKKMITDIKKDFDVTVWVHPFTNMDSDLFVEGRTNGYFLLDESGEHLALTGWWNGKNAAILDATNSNATGWFLEHLMNLTNEYGVDSFKFDAGEVGFLPKSFKTNVQSNNPNIYSQYYVNMAAKADHWNRQEVRVGSGTQNLPVMVRMIDKSSTWTNENGILTLIPTALVFGVLGYPFVLPDMVGGNAYNNYPDETLFIRWLQASLFMPVIQLSIAPWRYNINITRDMLDKRSMFAPYLLQLAKDAVNTGDPIIRPLWWIAPMEEPALVSDDEYLVGNDLLVAPILTNTTSRDVYLPSGWWVDQISRETLEGGRWISNYNATLAELPYFIKNDTDVELLQKFI